MFDEIKESRFFQLDNLLFDLAERMFYWDALLATAFAINGRNRIIHRKIFPSCSDNVCIICCNTMT